jgi:hypothetical protein
VHTFSVSEEYEIKLTPYSKSCQLKFTGSTLMRGFLCSPKVDFNADFFVSIIRNQELGCLLRRDVARCITGLLLRDAESFKGLPNPGMIIDRKDKFTLQTPEDSAQLSR